MHILDDTDRAILDLMQNQFPLAVQPYLVIAQALSLEEDEVLARIAVMKDIGLIRRIGGIIDSRNIGFYSTLCAIKVPKTRIETVADIINLIPGVTHNYLRDHEYNMWFTLTAPSESCARETLEELEAVLGLDIMEMPAQKVFKIKVSFDMGVLDDI